MVDLESLNEAISNELNDLKYLVEHEIKADAKVKEQLNNILSNLFNCNDKVYQAYEEQSNTEKQEEQERVFNAMMDEEIKPKLTWQEKAYIKIRYGIDLS